MYGKPSILDYQVYLVRTLQRHQFFDKVEKTPYTNFTLLCLFPHMYRLHSQQMKDMTLSEAHNHIDFEVDIELEVYNHVRYI